MLINQLPDDCFLTIFNYMNNVDDLINCFKVCNRWSHLVAVRTKKAKFFLNGNHSADNSLDCVYCRKWKPIDGSYLKTLFTNLMIVEFTKEFRQQIKWPDIVAMIRAQKSLKGVIVDKIIESMTENWDKIEMLATTSYEQNFRHNGYTKQLYIGKYASRINHSFFRTANYFPNIERLHIDGQGPLVLDKCPVLKKLKVIEMNIFDKDNLSAVDCKFIDLCPNLQSAYIRIPSGIFLVNEPLKTNNLQDLVLSFGSYEREIDWDDLKRFLIKCPNLKHLALRHVKMKDEHIEQFVKILPNLVLFDVYGCREVTQRAADYVRDYCVRYGRSIKFYLNEKNHEIKSDWPELSIKREKICRGFDFMKHCFLKRFDDLPYFLVPTDQ